MTSHPKDGKFIVIEGLDGSGSSSQVSRVVDFLKLIGVKTYLTKEPTDNVIGGLIRGALTGVYHVPNIAMQFLFSADRSHHLDRLVEPKLKEGYFVICDRYMWSSIAYGSIDLDKEWLLSMQQHFKRPDLTLFLKVDPKVCVERITKDRYDVELFEEVSKLQKVWETYDWLAKKYPKEIKVINAIGSEKDVFEEIVSYIRPMVKDIF